MSGRRRHLLATLGLIALFAGVTMSAPRWARLFRQAVPADEEQPAGPGAAPAPGPRRGPAPALEGEAGAEAQRTISVKLFFEAPDRRGLVLEDRAIPFSPDLPRQLLIVVEELIRGSRQGLVATLPPETKVLDVFVTARGVAYIDLSKEVSPASDYGSEAELLTVYSVVNSVTANFPAIRRVQLLVDDRPSPTLAGHVDLSRPLPPDMTLLAASGRDPS